MARAKTTLWAGILAVLAIALVLWILTAVPEAPDDSPKRTAGPDVPAGTGGAANSGISPAPGSGMADAGSVDTLPDLKAALAAARQAVETRQPPQEVAEAFEHLRTAVHAAMPDIAAAEIIRELESGWDSSTGLPFTVGQEGVLDSAPTWRSWLIDLLGQTDPTAFEAYSRQLLASTASSDEYTVALRNLAWVADTDAGWNEVILGFRTMLTRPEWMESPGMGLLESFDVAVAAGPETIPDLAQILQRPGRSDTDNALTHAAFVALDRLLLADPEGFLDIIGQNPALLQSAPDAAASLYSRLDVSETRQRQFLESWLVSQSATSDSIRYFFEILPNVNRFDGHRLVTPLGEAETTTSAAQADSTALGVLQSWLQDPRFANHRKDIQAAIDRLSAQEP